MLTIEDCQVQPYNHGLTKGQIGSLPRLSKTSRLVKQYKESFGIELRAKDRERIERLRSRLIRHLFDICPAEGDLDQKIQILNQLGENNPISAWHRRKIMGRVPVDHALVAENRIRFLIRELSIELLEKLEARP